MMKANDDESKGWWKEKTTAKDDENKGWWKQRMMKAKDDESKKGKPRNSLERFANN